MSIVELGHAAQRRLADTFCRKRIVFHHVPKCGGTSVGRSLRVAYLLSQGTVTPEESHKAFTAVRERQGDDQSIADVRELREMMFLYLLYSDVRCISAHIPFSDVAHREFQERYAFVTLLREPVERFVSHYLWSSGRPDAFAGIRDEYANFLSSERASWLGTAYVRYFAGRPLESFPNMASAVGAAIANLHRLDHVGFLDEMQQFEAALRQLTGKRLRIGRENVGKRRPLADSLATGELRQRVLDLCAPDRDIWDAVQALRIGG